MRDSSIETSKLIETDKKKKRIKIGSFVEKINYCN